MQRVQWVDPSDDPNSAAAANSVGKSWNCDLLFQDSGCLCLSSLYYTSWNLMTCVRAVGGPRGEKGGGLRAILVALSMPSAGLGEPELDAGLGVGVALDSLDVSASTERSCHLFSESAPGE